MSEAKVAVDSAAAAPSLRTTRRRFGPLAFFLTLAFALAIPYSLSVLWLAGAAALTGAEPGFGISGLYRFNLIYIALIALLATSLRTEHDAIRRDFEAFRALVVGSDEEWRRWQAELFAPSLARVAAWVVAGALLGQIVNFLGGRLGGQRPGVWIGHYVWMGVLATGLFALIVTLAAFSLRRARAFLAMGRRARVRLLDPSELAPFARAGLRGSAYWFLGTSLATLLMIDSGTWGLVALVNTGTMTLGVVSLFLPSRGVHESLRAAKRLELARLHDRIERARATLFDHRVANADSSRMPALLAWEARVQQMSVWPFDASTLVRFVLFLLVPLGSWVGGALVERAVDTLIP